MRFPACLAILFFAVACNNQGTGNPLPDKRSNDTNNTLSRPDRAVNPYSPVDVSPMDMTYFPVDYPKIRAGNSNTPAPLARVIYSRPHLQGRTLFGGVLKYGEPWRLGANESTELELFRDAQVNGQKLRAGRYILYCIPEQDKWNIIINSNIDTWGLHPDSSKDVAKFTVPVQPAPGFLEFFTMVFEGTGRSATLVMGWERTEARLTFTF